MIYNRNNMGFRQNNPRAAMGTQSNNQGNNMSSVRPDTGASEKDFTKDPRLADVDPLKLKIINEIQKKSKGRSIEELLPEIMQINQELKRRNMSFTTAEIGILLEVIEDGLSPDEKKKFNMIKGFIN